MRRLGWLLAIGLATAWCTPASAQFLDQDKAEIAKNLKDAWLSDLPVNGVAQTDGIGMCVEDGNLYARDRLLDKNALIKRVAITILPDKHIALAFLQKEGLESFLRSIPYLSLCKGTPHGAYADTFFVVSSVNGQSKLSALWALQQKH